ncbi:IclR family transcriptional regulator [Streptomyces chartreusis]|uniref:IclR family transcriptional regulator n=1 Tax=Streptomyces chartreusis TaxID=1969 RepID=UPI001675FDBE|nr:IclR family transcriptional regulator [Streptomyces chartreusis]GGX58032.1 hypothetical protein GCM10010321_88700 [Streptomyces chartreusis]
MFTTASQTPAMQPTDPRQAGATAHALRVKEVELAVTLLGGPEHGLSEIAEAAGLNATVVHRILRSCLPSRYFVQAPGKKYRLGPGAAAIGMHAMAHAPGVDASRPLLEELSLRLDGMAVLWVYSPYGGPRRALVDHAPGRYDLDALGLTATELTALNSSLRVGASGRAMAAVLPEALMDLVLAQSVPVTAGPGVLGDAEYRTSLGQVREAGYGVGLDEIAGWGEVAAPVLWGETLYGAISVLKPTSLLTDIADAAALTMAAADRLSLLVAGGRLPPAT